MCLLFSLVDTFLFPQLDFDIRYAVKFFVVLLWFIMCECVGVCAVDVL